MDIGCILAQVIARWLSMDSLNRQRKTSPVMIVQRSLSERMSQSSMEAYSGSSRAVYHRPLKLTGAWSCKEEQPEGYSTVDCRGRIGACAGCDLREVKKEKEEEEKREEKSTRQPRDARPSPHRPGVLPGGILFIWKIDCSPSRV